MQVMVKSVKYLGDLGFLPSERVFRNFYIDSQRYTYQPVLATNNDFNYTYFFSFFVAYLKPELSLCFSIFIHLW